MYGGSLCMITLLFYQVALKNLRYPKGFVWGVSTSSYQIEGAWNEGGKGEHIWDHYLHKDPTLVVDRTNGDVACDSYHKWKEDVELLKNLGVDFYRFSISWTRILPLGSKDTEINKEGVQYYNDLIDALLAEGIKPYVTIHHFDLPQNLQNKGGWLNETIIEDYIYYAKQLFQLYGDRVKHWITFNEFSLFCEGGYSKGRSAPFLNLTGVGGYQCTHQALLAHGRTYRMYEREFKPSQGGEIGVSVAGEWCEPITSSKSDRYASERCLEFGTGWSFNPITLGNYPQTMIERIDEFSKLQGYKESRLPKFTTAQVSMMKGSFDFLGLNHYTTNLCTFGDNFTQPSVESDCGVQKTIDPSWEVSAASMITYTPWGLRKLLNYLREKYGNPRVLITENGWAAKDTDLDDSDRMPYLEGYLTAILRAIREDGCKVIGYSHWSMMDDFEWTNGYTLKFGLIHVDFGSPNRTRRIRSSYRLLKEMISTRRVI